MRIRRQRRLHAHLDRLPRTQREIGEELGARAGREVDDGLVGVGEPFIAVEVLEDLVEAVFPRALEAVADEGRRPAEEDAADAFGPVDGRPGGQVGAVDFGVDLAPAFDEVEGGDGGVGGSAGWRRDGLAFGFGDCEWEVNWSWIEGLKMRVLVEGHTNDST